jgi:hypothetical protein
LLLARRAIQRTSRSVSEGTEVGDPQAGPPGHLTVRVTGGDLRTDVPSDTVTQ